MRYLLSTAAAAALLASPALAQTVDVSALESDLSGAGFQDTQELQGIEMHSAMDEGQQAIVFVLPEGAEPGLAAAPDMDDPAETAAVPDDPDIEGPEDELAADPDVEAPETGVIDGLRDQFEQAGFSDIQNLTGQAIQTTTDDGRTAFVLLADDFGGEPGMPGAPGVDPDMPETDID